MSWKELLGDSIKTLSRKVSSSFALNKDDRENNDTVEQDAAGRLTVSQASSITAVSSNRDDSVQLSEKPSPVDRVDAVESAEVASPDATAEITDTHILDLATASFPLAPEDQEIQPLTKPVLIPRLDPGGAIPFARAWAPELADHAIIKEDFVAFIDNLNIIITPHVAFRVLELAGFAVGLVPYDVAEGVGGALEAIAIIGAIVVNYKRTKEYMRLINEKYFHPRKLHVKIIGTKRLKKQFELDKKDPCLAPLTEDTLELTSQERCLRYLSQYSCELSFDVPPPSPVTTMLAKITAWRIRHKVHKADKMARAGRKRAWKRHQKGKKPQGRWESWGEKFRVKSLDWILVQNLAEWEAQRAEKGAKKKERKKKKGWRGIV
ncbi:hypothetical protein F5Y03DRAFT_294074 [Xylaria venustula]|nr:hypothetical protein F5Y03DRAFT_294074 [Xylaria venustula]